MKKIFAIVAILLGIVLVVMGMMWAARTILAGEPSSHASSTVACTTYGVDHLVTIKDDRASQTTIVGRLCDTLTIVNEDPTFREIAFGPHEEHQAYDGVTAKLLEKGQSLKVVMNQVGAYHFHDHIHDEVEGDFIVRQ